jgi:hypothetical protein
MAKNLVPCYTIAHLQLSLVAWYQAWYDYLYHENCFCVLRATCKHLPTLHRNNLQSPFYKPSWDAIEEQTVLNLSVGI